jgi:ABC-type xylose transport system permease subunit
MKNLKVFDMKKPNEMNIVERLSSPTPPLFKKLRTIGVVIGVVGGALATAPVSLPVAIVSLSGYLITIGSVITAVSSVAVDDEGK